MSQTCDSAPQRDFLDTIAIISYSHSFLTAPATAAATSTDAATAATTATEPAAEPAATTAATATAPAAIAAAPAAPAATTAAPAATATIKPSSASEYSKCHIIFLPRFYNVPVYFIAFVLMALVFFSV